MDRIRLKSACERVLQQVNQLNLPLNEEGQNQPQDSDFPLRSAIEKENEVDRKRLWAEFRGYGPLSDLLKDESVREIVINGCENIWLEKEEGFVQFPDSFLSEITLNNFVHRLCGETGLNINLQTPCGDTDWNGFRVHMMRPPLSERLQITMRSRPREPWTFEQLQSVGWATGDSITQLRLWLKQKKNLLIVGPTGAGKTSILNACLQEFGASERVLCLEDINELSPRLGASCKILTRADNNGLLQQFSLGDLVRQALRMRPSRLVIGEVRGGEAKDLLLALATGHRGSLGTLHAADPRQALLRLEMLVQLGAGQWDQNAIRQLIQLSIDGIVVTGFRDGKRSLEGLYRIASLESIGFLLERTA